MTEWGKQKGFTIVELLIVVVVIAILAAITIVAYNGIQQRAKDSAAQSAASQAVKKTMLFAVDNAETFPADLTALAAVLGIPAPAAGASFITAPDGTTYQYSVNNSSTPRSYCITTTKNNVSFYNNSLVGQTPTKGACVGHVANGATLITNLIINPRPSNSFWFASGPIAGISYVNSGINSAVRSNRTSTGNYGLYSSRSSPVATAQTGDTYTILFTIASSANMNLTYQIGYGTSTSSISALNLPLTLTAGQTQSLRHVITIPAGFDGQPIFNKFLWQDGSAGEWFEVSKVMWVKGDYAGQYADGESTGWAWSGAANNSISTGPAL